MKFEPRFKFTVVAVGVDMYAALATERKRASRWQRLMRTYGETANIPRVPAVF